jgi:amino acid adenylation domain-containing protein
VLLCEAATAGAVGEVALPRLDIGSIAAAGSPCAVALSPRSAAYTIYTSGSTGTPKGVVAHHRGVLNCFAGTQALVPMRETDTLLAIATFAFDASILELFMPLVYGARLALATREEAADGTTLVRAIEQYQATRIFTAPAAWRLLVSAGWSGKSDLVGISWAEPLTRDLAAALLPRLAQLWNLYGPTETTVWMLGRRISDASAPITIGRPIPNTRAYILDAAGRPVGRGVTGELYIGGAGVALGYLNRPELDAERFLPDPFANGGEDARMYRTGDLARWTADGEIECLGRADFQVKLRGYRIELGEIEAVLNGHAQVAEAVVGVAERSAGDPRLVAWVEPRAGAELGSSELRRHVRQSLPGYMVPQHFVTIARLPRLPNGKLDRRALPDPFVSEIAAPISKTPPRSDAERVIFRIWSEVLGHTDIGAEDRFLDIGGHSMLAVQVAAQIQQQFGVKPPLRIVMMESLAQLAAACQMQSLHEPDSDRQPAEAQDPGPLETAENESSTGADRPSGGKSVSWWKKWLKP